jgi:hypothetical protein
MTNREAEIDGNKLTTFKTVKDEEGADKVEVYENRIQKAPVWLIAMLKYLPLVLILLTADWGYRMWNGIGMGLAAAYMYWFLWMVDNKPKQFYPVTISAVLVITAFGLFFGKLIYVNHIISMVINLFLMKILYDDLMFKQYNHYFTVEDKAGMFVYTPNPVAYGLKNQKHIGRFLIGIMGISLVMITVNGAILFQEYRQGKLKYDAWVAQDQKNTQEMISGRAELIAEKPVEENLSKSQRELREQLGIEE